MQTTIIKPDWMNYNPLRTAEGDDVRLIAAASPAMDLWRENGGRYNAPLLDDLILGGWNPCIVRVETDAYEPHVPRGSWLFYVHERWQDGNLVLVRLPRPGGGSALRLRHIWIDADCSRAILIPPGIAFTGGDPPEPGDLFDLGDLEDLSRDCSEVGVIEGMLIPQADGTMQHRHVGAFASLAWAECDLTNKREARAACPTAKGR